MARLSITKRQRETQAATDLIALCLTVTEDGTLSESEVAEIADWLEEHRNSDLPAVEFLVATVEQILADGVVTDEERQALYKAVETILPPDIRTGVVAKRRAVELVEKAHKREEKEHAREERQRNTRVAHYDFMVAGVHYEGRGKLIGTYLYVKDQVYLVREPANVHSRNATAVVLSNGVQIGYVPEFDASDMAPLLDGGHKHLAYCKKILRGRKVPIPVVIADLYHPEATVDGLVTQEQTPERRKVGTPGSKSGVGSGCAGAIALGMALAGTAFALLLLFV